MSTSIATVGATFAEIPIPPGNVIPLTTAPNQSLVITPVVNGVPITLQLDLIYNEMAGYWSLSISNSIGTLLLSSLPLITGSYPAANILKQYGYLGIGSAYVINTSNSGYDYPNNYNLGSEFVLVWGDTAP